MKNSAPRAPLALFAGLLAATPATGQVRIAAPAALATPTPTPRPVMAPFRPATPVHAPDALDFGAVFDGESSRRTFTLTANGAGYVSADVPEPWRVAESRVMAPGFTTGGSMAVRNVKSRVVDPPKPWQWSLAVDEEIQIDVVFAPKFDLAKMTAGPKSGTMRVTGPGPQGTWNLPIALAGTFNGVKLKPVFVAQDREIYAVGEVDAARDVTLSVSSVGGPLNATIRPGALPPGVTMLPVGVAVAANATVKPTVRLSFSWGASGLPMDGQPRSVEFLLDVPGGPQKAAVSLVPVPSSFSRTWEKRTDCGVGEFNLQYSVNTQRNGLVWAWGSNVDLVNKRYVWWEVRVPGEVVGSGHVQFDERKYVATREQSRPYPVRPETMAKLARGPVTMACGLMEVRGGVLVKP